MGAMETVGMIRIFARSVSKINCGMPGHTITKDEYIGHVVSRLRKMKQDYKGKDGKRIGGGK